MSSLSNFFRTLAAAFLGREKNFTTGSTSRAIFMLAVPMILEMLMESLFAIVDIYFVGKVSINAVATVALTESVIILIFAIAIGLSMSVTAIVARRIGEQNPDAAAHATMQSIYLAIAISLVFSLIGWFFAPEILQLMGGEEDLVNEGQGYTRIMLTGNITIMLLFLINAAFRGAGDASLAMRVLWVANGLNIILDPIFIFGLGPIPAFGVEGAAIATNIGRGTGVALQIYTLMHASSSIRIGYRHLRPEPRLISELVKLSLGGIGQFMIGTLSWLFLVRISAIFGSSVLAGYAIAFRIIMFTILPASGLASAAATLVGQNLGANQPERAEKSVWQCCIYNMIFLCLIAVAFLAGGEHIIGFFATDEEVIAVGKTALNFLAFGYILFAYGMVISQAFNGAGDTMTPTKINFFCFWLFEIPLAYLLAHGFGMGPQGIFAAIAVSLWLYAIASIVLFRKGSWKTVSV